MNKRFIPVGLAVFLLLAATQVSGTAYFYRQPLHGLTASGPQNSPPEIQGTSAVAGEVGTTILPLAGVMIVDPEDTALTVTVEVLNAAVGSLTESATHSLVGTGAAVTADLRSIVFTPTEGRLEDGASEDVEIKLSVIDGAGAYASKTLTLTVSAPEPTGMIIWVSGDNAYGKLGLGDTVDRLTAEALPLSKDWIRISTNYFNQGDHHAAITASGELWTWGRNYFGTLGINNQVDSLVPVQVSSTSPWIYVGTGSRMSIGLQADGTLWGWGQGQFAGLGTTDSWKPKKIGAGWKSLSVGFNHALALKTDGTLWSWGGVNIYGQLCLGDMAAKNKPTRVGSETDWKKIYAGSDVTMMIRDDGSLWACGDNSSYNLGLGDKTKRLLPVRVGMDVDWKEIAIGGDHVLAIKNNGSLWAWGANMDYQTGIPSDWGDDIMTPTQVGTDTDWIAVSAGDRGSLGIKSDGSLWGWGEDREMLGYPSADTPTRLGTENTWRSVSHGNLNSFAIKDAE